MQNTIDFIRKHKVKIVISFAISLFLIFIVSFVVGLEDIVNVLSRTNLYLIAFTMFLGFTIILGWTLRWKLILEALHSAPEFKQLILIMFTSLFGNNITPGAAGGEPLRAYLLNKFEDVPFETAFASATADRVFEFFPFVLVSTLAAYFIFTLNIGFLSGLVVSIMIIVAMIFFGLIIYVGYSKEVSTRIIISIAKRVYPFIKKLSSRETSFTSIKEKLTRYIETFTIGFHGILKDHRTFIVGVLVSFAMWGIDNLRFYLTFVAIGYYPLVIPMIIIYTISILVSILPTLPGALGIREGTMVALFLPVGVPAEVVLAVSLLDRLVTFILPTLVGAVTMLYYGKKYKENKVLFVRD